MPERESLPVWGDPTESVDEWYATQRKAQAILDGRDVPDGQLMWLRVGGYDGRGWETVLGIKGIH